MRGLILRLQHIDSPAEQAVKIIEFYDTLVRNHAHLDDLLRATTGLTECTVGITDLSSGQCRAYDASGAPVAHADQIRGRAHMTNPVTHRGSTVAELWLVGQEASATDDIILERLAIACDLLWVDGEDQMLSRAVEAVLSDQLDEMSRLMHLRRLLMNPTGQVRVLAVAREHGQSVRVASPALDHLSRCLELTAVPPHVLIGNCLALIVPCEVSDTISSQVQHSGALPVTSHIQEMPGWFITIGPCAEATQAWKSWQAAHRTLNLMTRVPELTGTVAYAADLESLSLLTSLSSEDADCTDLERVRTLQHEHPHVVSTVATLLRTGNLRAAGAALHLHHSTVAARARQFERATGLSMDDSLERLRAAIAIIVVGTEN